MGTIRDPSHSPHRTTTPSQVSLQTSSAQRPALPSSPLPTLTTKQEGRDWGTELLFTPPTSSPFIKNLNFLLHFSLRDEDLDEIFPAERMSSSSIISSWGEMDLPSSHSIYSQESRTGETCRQHKTFPSKGITQQKNWDWAERELEPLPHTTTLKYSNIERF